MKLTREAALAALELAEDDHGPEAVRTAYKLVAHGPALVRLLSAAQPKASSASCAAAQ
jgi:hypothetical protein